MRRVVKRLGIAVAACVLCAAGTGCEDFRSFWGRRSLEQDVTAMRDPIFADERRSGIAGIQRRDELTDPAYQAEFHQIASKDTAPAVRAQAARALNQSRDASSSELFEKLLEDTSPAVRLEAVKAFRNMPADRVVPKLIAIAGDNTQDRDVRVWATAALGSFPRVDVARALVPLLEARDFSVAAQARVSLMRLTGRDFHYEQGLWLQYLQGPGAVRAPATRRS